MAKKKAATKRPAKKRGTKARTPPFDNYPTWSESKFWSFIRSGLRAKWSRWPPKFEALKRAHRPYKGEGRQKHEYQCAICEDWYKQAEVEVDHIIPAGSLKGYDDLPGFVRRLFVGPEALRVLCKPCHKEVTKKEKADAEDASL